MEPVAQPIDDRLGELRERLALRLLADAVDEQDAEIRLGWLTGTARVAGALRRRRVGGGGVALIRHDAISERAFSFSQVVHPGAAD